MISQRTWPSGINLLQHHSDRGLLYLLNAFMMFHTTAWVGAEGMYYLGLERRNPPQHKVTCDSPGLFCAPRLRSFWRGQQVNNHRLCQAISCKCPQFEEQHFRNGPAYGRFNALIGRSEAALSNHLPASSFITRSTINLMGMCRGEVELSWLSLTVSHLSTSQDITRRAKSSTAYQTVSALTFDFYSKGWKL